MSLLAEDSRWGACLSALRLDRWLLGELTSEARAAVQAHLLGCGRCRAAVDTLMATDVATPTPAPDAAAARGSGGRMQARSGRRGWMVGVGGGLLAATLVLALYTEEGTRTKGGAGNLGMYVQHAGEVRRAGPGEVVAPGDALRFTVTVREPRYVAVFSVDPTGTATVYWPAQGGRAAAVEAGADVPLSSSTELDRTVGEEQVVGLFCTSPVELEPVRQALRERPTGSLRIAGCTSTRWSFVKRAP